VYCCALPRDVPSATGRSWGITVYRNSNLGFRLVVQE
jgi:hypothetical protein